MSKSLYIPLLDNGGGDVKASFMMSFIRAFSGTNYDVQIARFGDSHPGRARNKAAASFLDSGKDFLLFIDADIVFEPEHVTLLMQSEEPLLCGIYPKKQPGVHLCSVMPQGFAGFTEETKGQAVPCRRSGTGFMRIHRSVLDKLKETADIYDNHGRPEWDFFKSGVKNREWLSEDWYFCDMATEAGFQPMLHTGIQTLHEGAATYPLPERPEWQSVHGWFTEEDAECYRKIAEAMPENGGRFAEVGVWQGRSFACMATMLKEKGKTAEMIAVDTFTGTSDEDIHTEMVAACGGSTLSAFLGNMHRIGVPGSLKVMQGQSGEVAEEIENHSLDAAFIDAGHSRSEVLKDLCAWIPKVKPGGILAGHDYDYPEVAEVVNTFSKKVTAIGRCWLITL